MISPLKSFRSIQSLAGQSYLIINSSQPPPNSLPSAPRISNLMPPTKAIKITYDLKIPSTVSSGNEPTQKTFEFPVQDSIDNDPDLSTAAGANVNDTKAYCTALRKALE
ncbi:hypothetical protein CVT26_013091, partial [Gymnopilus dilepis]